MDSVEIKALLIELRDSWLMKTRVIAREVGISESFLSGVSRGKRKGGRQLLAGLKLLKRVIELENRPPPKTAEQELAELKMRFALLEKSLGRTSYPEHQPQGHALNEAMPSSDADQKAQPGFDQLHKLAEENRATDPAESKTTTGHPTGDTPAKPAGGALPPKAHRPTKPKPHSARPPAKTPRKP